MKTMWIKPELVVLSRGNPQNAVLLGCKNASSGSSSQSQNTNCEYYGACHDCNVVSDS